jgi:hypothetical protein
MQRLGVVQSPSNYSSLQKEGGQCNSALLLNPLGNVFATTRGLFYGCRINFQA